MDFLSLAEKEKGKVSTILGRHQPNQPRPMQNPGALTTTQLVLQKSPYRFKSPNKSPRHYLRVSLTFTLHPLFSISSPEQTLATTRSRLATLLLGLAMTGVGYPN